MTIARSINTEDFDTAKGVRFARKLLAVPGDRPLSEVPLWEFEACMCMLRNSTEVDGFSAAYWVFEGFRHLVSEGVPEATAFLEFLTSAVSLRTESGALYWRYSHYRQKLEREREERRVPADLDESVLLIKKAWEMAVEEQDAEDKEARDE